MVVCVVTRKRDGQVVCAESVPETHDLPARYNGRIDRDRYNATYLLYEQQEGKLEHVATVIHQYETPVDYALRKGTVVLP